MLSSSKSYSAQFILSSPNACPQEMVGVRGTWNQTSVESKCKVSIWEYPDGGSCVSIRSWEGREECWLPEPHSQKCQGQTEMVLSTKQRESMRIRAFIWSQLPADCSWATADFLEHNNCHRAWFLLLRFYHLSNTCGVLLHMSKRIFRFHLGSQTSGYPELKSNWRTQMKNQQVNRKQYSK